MNDFTATETAFEDYTPPAHLVQLSLNFPDLAVRVCADGVFELTLADSDAFVAVRYWKVEPVQSGADAWRYELSHTTAQAEYVGPFSHPTERGCWIMARKYFVESGFIPTPKDNSHLSEPTRAIVEGAQKARTERAGRFCAAPEVGDIIIDADGAERRACTTSRESCQTTTAMEYRYYCGPTGTGSYSGSCGQSVYYQDVQLAGETRPALFWTFKDGRSGAGRGVDFWLDVEIWTYRGTFGDGLWGNK